MIKNLFKDLFYEADLFKVNFVLLFQNRKKSSTIVGSLFSISLVAIVIYLFVTSNMLLKVNPIVIDQTTTNDHASLLEMTIDNFGIAAGVADSFGLGYSDPTIFKVQFVQIEIEFNETINSKQIKRKLIKRTEQCSPANFNDPLAFGNLGLANYTCLKNATFQLEGGFDERMVKSLVVMISYCNNETDGVVCKTPTEISKFFQGKGLWLYYQDDIYDISNYNKPLMKNWRLQAIQVAAVPRIIDLYLKKLIFINDDQFIFSNENFQYGFMKERSEGLSHYVMVESPLISINLFSSKNNQRTKRQYQKFGDLLASIGGVINCLIILGFFITNLENQLQMQNFIMNKLYSYSYEKKEKLKKKKTTAESAKLKTDPKVEEIYDWNKDYDEMISKDILNNPRKEKSISKQPSSAILKESRVSGREVHFNDPPESNSREIELFIPISQTMTNSLIPQIKEEVKILKTEGYKSKFFSKPETPKLHVVINNSNLRGLNKAITPEHSRQNTSQIKPKENSSVDMEQSCRTPVAQYKQGDEYIPVALTITEYFRLQAKMFFRKDLSTKEKLFVLSEKRFKHETDICYILEKIQEFEKFKLIILNSEQLEIFNLLSKPLIYLESQRDRFQSRASFRIGKSMDFDFSWKNDARKRINELKNLHRKLSNEKSLSMIDRNLLKLIEDDIYSK